MDVLMLSGELGAGGAPRVIYQVAKHLPADIDKTVCYLGGRDDLTERFERADIPVVRLSDDPYSIASVRRFHRLLREYSPDIVHTHMVIGGLVGRPLASLYGVPAIHTVHTNYRMRPPIAKILDVLSAPFGQCAVCVSESVERSLPAYYASETTVIHNCIDVLEVVQEGASEWEELDWTADLDPDAPVVANIARYDPKKRRADIVEGFSRVVDDHPEAQLVLTGRRGGRHQSELAELARSLGVADNVFFVGFVENPQTVYHHSDLVVFGSESEGFSIGLLEAMAHSRPIIATDIPAFVEALGEDYPGLVPVRSPTELGSAIAEVLEETRQHDDLVAATSSRIGQFEGKTAADAYTNLYREYQC